MSRMQSVVLAGAMSAFLLGGCAIDPYTGEEKVSQTAKGAGIGAVGGAVAGAVISGDRRGAVTGAVAGAAIGGGIGYYMDRQEAALRQRLEGTGVRVQRHGDQIKLIMPGNVTFDVNSDQIRSGFTSVLDSVALVIKEFDQTVVDIKGFTDSTGSFEYNQQLSERRAGSVARYFINQQIPAGRLRTTGYGPRYPIASNDTPEGRAQNRRVEIDLLPAS